MVILGDNVFEDAIKDATQAFEKSKAAAKIFLKEVSDPERFGVVEIKEQQIVSIEEKPKKPKSNYAIVGIYMYAASVFEIVKKLKPSARGELEISDVNRACLESQTLEYQILKGWWTDAGTFESLERAHRLAKGEKN